jgi:hypothetical protein
MLNACNACFKPKTLTVECACRAWLAAKYSVKGSLQSSDFEIGQI